MNCDHVGRGKETRVRILFSGLFQCIIESIVNVEHWIRCQMLPLIAYHVFNHVGSAWKDRDNNHSTLRGRAASSKRDARFFLFDFRETQTKSGALRVL